MACCSPKFLFLVMLLSICWCKSDWGCTDLKFPAALDVCLCPSVTLLAEASPDAPSLFWLPNFLLRENGSLCIASKLAVWPYGMPEINKRMIHETRFCWLLGMKQSCTLRFQISNLRFLCRAQVRIWIINNTSPREQVHILTAQSLIQRDLDFIVLELTRWAVIQQRATRKVCYQPRTLTVQSDSLTDCICGSHLSIEQSHRLWRGCLPWKRPTRCASIHLPKLPST